MSKIGLNNFLLCMGLILFFSGCNNDKSAAQSELDKNSSLWTQQNISDYQISSQTFCFCVGSREIVNVVEQSQVSSAFVVGSGEYLTSEALNYQKSIPGYFAIIQDAIDREAASLVVSYHATLGYPSRISIDYDVLIADEEITYELTNFKQGIENIEKPELNLQLVLRDQFEQASEVFLQGEIINFYLTISNTGNQTANMSFYNAQQFDFTIASTTSFDGEVRWRWSDDLAFLAVLTELVIEPGETVAFSTDWDQVLANEQNLAVGDYVIDAYIIDTGIDVQAEFSIE